jgi:hypothetical protein
MTGLGPPDRLLVRYGGSTLIRALIRLVPFGIGGATDVVLMKRVETIKEEQARTFLITLAVET